MVAIVFDYRNLFDILKSIHFVENCVWLPLCLGPRMHEGQNRVPGSIKRTKLGYMTAVVAWNEATISTATHFSALSTYVHDDIELPS